MTDYTVFAKVSTLAPEPSDLGERYVLTGVASNTALSGFNNSIITATGSPNKMKWHYEQLQHGDTVTVYELTGTTWSGKLYKYSSVDGLVFQFNISIA